MVNDTSAPNPGDPPSDAVPVSQASQAPNEGFKDDPKAPTRTIAGVGIAAWAVVALLLVFSGAALMLVLGTQQRVKALETELVRRQESSGSLASEARSLARQAEVSARESAAKVALMEARIAETTVQRGMLEELLQSLARSRDENVLADVDAAIRVAMQQTAITGTAEPLVLTLRQVDERLARYNQPRLEAVRRSIALDLERIRDAGVTDVAVLTIKLNEVLRTVDQLPLLSAPQQGRNARAAEAIEDKKRAAAKSAGSAAELARVKEQAGKDQTSPPAESAWSAQLLGAWRNFSTQVWGEARDLVRVTRIDDPEAVLVAPEQAFFLRENLKLRLLNARLALLSRQFEVAQSDLRDTRLALDRYFDRDARQVSTASEVLRQVAAQAKQVAVPRPDATLAAIAIATAAAGR